MIPRIWEHCGINGCAGTMETLMITAGSMESFPWEIYFSE